MFPIGSMGLGYLPIWMVDFYGINVGKYTVRPMDPMGLVLSKSYPIIWDGKPLPGFQSPVRMITFFSFSQDDYGFGISKQMFPSTTLRP